LALTRNEKKDEGLLKISWEATRKNPEEKPAQFLNGADNSTNMAFCPQNFIVQQEDLSSPVSRLSAPFRSHQKGFAKGREISSELFLVPGGRFLHPFSCTVLFFPREGACD